PCEAGVPVVTRTEDSGPSLMYQNRYSALPKKRGGRACFSGSSFHSSFFFSWGGPSSSGAQASGAPASGPRAAGGAPSPAEPFGAARRSGDRGARIGSGEPWAGGRTVNSSPGREGSAGLAGPGSPHGPGPTDGPGAAETGIKGAGPAGSGSQQS